MSIENHLFLSGWGFKANLWQVFYPEISSKQCLDMPCFESGNEEQILHYLSMKLAESNVMHAWSHSGLWVLKLIQQNKLDIKDKRIYCYGLPLLWQFADEAKKYAFMRQYELNPNRLSQKFLKLVGFPKLDKLEAVMPYYLLADKMQYQSQLHYLKWMFAFGEAVAITDAVALCKKAKIHVFLAQDDAIVSSAPLAKLLNSELIKNQSHLGLLQLVLNEVHAC